MHKVFTNSIISFKKLPFYNKANIQLAQDYEIPAKNSLDEDYFVKMSYEPTEGEYSAIIYNEHYENIAKNKFLINKTKKELYATNMDVWDKKNRNKGLGEILHLNNIMELLENKLKTIRVFSLAPAIFFHSKYKFEPTLTNYDDILEAMYTISTKDCSSLPRLQETVDEAAEVFDNVFAASSFNPQYGKNIKKANQILKDYINIINNTKLPPDIKEYYAFTNGITMTLSKESIIENKNFFNNLFKKHSIDYEI